MTEQIAERWIRVEVAELAPGRTRAVLLEDIEVLICNVDGKLFAVENRCSHAHVALTYATLHNGVLECPVHAARFDAKTGAVVARPARRGLRTFPVVVDDEGVKIALPVES